MPTGNTGSVFDAARWWAGGIETRVSCCSCNSQLICIPHLPTPVNKYLYRGLLDHPSQTPPPQGPSRTNPCSPGVGLHGGVTLARNGTIPDHHVDDLSSTKCPGCARGLAIGRPSDSLTAFMNSSCIFYIKRTNSQVTRATGCSLVATA